MKFSQKHEQMQKESETRKLLSALEESVDFILLNKQQAVSFQLAYDHVFKLTKLGRQNDVLNMLQDKLGVLIKGKLAALKKGNLEELADLLREFQAVATRMSEICLFLDINYCQKVMHLPLKKRLFSDIFKNVTNDNKPLSILAQAAFQNRNQPSSDFKQMLALVDDIDEKGQLFEHHLLPHYLPLLSHHYAKAAAEVWNHQDLAQYISWCREELAREEQFAEGVLARRKKREGVEAAVACVYQAVVSEYKDRIYQSDERGLFEVLTLPLLQLLKFGKGKEVEGHILWFMSALERRLDLLGTEDNAQFICNFCGLYRRVGELLKGTQSKFQINYRSVFTFEEWINNQKFKIPLRLNIFIDEQLTYGCNSQNFEEFLGTVILIFKLVKEKTIFENMYRRTMIDRLVHQFVCYDLTEEYRLILAMQEECGEDWGTKLKSICDLFAKDRDHFVKARNLTEAREDVGGLVPLVVSENDWPFETNNKIQITPKLLSMTEVFTKEYLPEATKHKLWWSSKVGEVTLSIDFNSNKREFLVSVDMANLLLYLQKGPAKLKSFLSEHCYALDEAEGFLQPLVSNKIIRSEAEGNDYKLKLADSFEGGKEVIDLVRKKKGMMVDAKVMEELKADRKLMVEAILVKIMKGQKVCRRQELLEKSAPLVVQRGFKFNGDFVDKSVERLIEKEFIRDFQDGTLGYIA